MTFDYWRVRIEGKEEVIGHALSAGGSGVIVRGIGEGKIPLDRKGGYWEAPGTGKVRLDLSRVLSLEGIQARPEVLEYLGRKGG